MDEEIIRELLDTKDFYKVVDKNNLYKYQLLDFMRYGIYNYSSPLEMQEKEILKEIYRDKGCMLKVKDDAVVFISDTHYDYSSLDRKNMNRWDLLYYVLDFCKYNKIRYLIHGGDIGDGTIEVNGIKHPINIEVGSDKIAEEQVDNIISDYPSVPFVHQSVLGGNHDDRYLDYEIDILKGLADKKNIYPLGYLHAFISIDGGYISLEHENHPYRIECRNLIPHDLSIHGHSHIASFQDNDVYIPALGGFLNHKGEEGGEPGFIVMYPNKESDSIHLEFEHHYLKDGRFVKKPEPYVYKLKRK